jgi:hypothetical protein
VCPSKSARSCTKQIRTKPTDTTPARQRPPKKAPGGRPSSQRSVWVPLYKEAFGTLTLSGWCTAFFESENVLSFDVRICFELIGSETPLFPRLSARSNQKLVTH